MAEELALEECLGDGAAVDGDEGAGMARAVRVYGAGHQLLAGAALALAEHGGIRLGDPLDHREDVAHLGRGAEDVREAD